MLKYIIDWGDGSTSSTEFLTSSETVTIQKTWALKGDHEVRAKARDVFGKESGWSDTLTVTVENNDPGKPLKPVGETQGNIKTSYSYTTSSTDPDDHRVNYGWDWNGDQIVDEWTELYDSGSSITTSHTWNDQGTFDVRVKAQDEYGDESEWSDPLSVIMPKISKHHDFIIDKKVNLWFIQGVYMYIDEDEEFIYGKAMTMTLRGIDNGFARYHLLLCPIKIQKPFFGRMPQKSFTFYCLGVCLGWDYDMQ
jgi:hypothetical protein